jgi:hypothetical protein
MSESLKLAWFSYAVEISESKMSRTDASWMRQREDGLAQSTARIASFRMLNASWCVASDGVQGLCDHRHARCSGGVLTADVVDKPETAMRTSPLQ